MAFKYADSEIGMQPLTETSTTQNHELGKIVKGVDPDAGEGKFIYLKGVGSTVVGSWVTYNADDWSTTLIVANAIGPVAVAMSANVANQYGWYQVFGKASAKAAVVSDNGKVYIDSVAGLCDDAVVAGDKVHNAKWASASTASGNLAEVEIEWPFCTDEST